MGCKYSLSGYEIQAKTAKVNFFENQAPVQSASLSQVFTNKLESKLSSDTPLRLVQSDGELEFSGAIVGYQLAPEAISGNEVTQKTRLTVVVNVNYEDKLDEEKNFQQTFSASDVYDANLDLSSVENQLLDNITDQLVIAIFNRAFLNDW